MPSLEDSQKSPRLDRFMMWGTRAVEVRTITGDTLGRVIIRELSSGQTRGVPSADLRAVREPVGRYEFHA